MNTEFDKIYEELSILNEGERYYADNSAEPFAVILTGKETPDKCNPYCIRRPETCKTFATKEEALECFIDEAEMFKDWQDYDEISLGYLSSGETYAGENYHWCVEIFSEEVIRKGDANGIYNDKTKQEKVLNDYNKYIDDAIAEAKANYDKFIYSEEHYW